MNILLSCIGKRSYIADFFRTEMRGRGKIIGTSNTAWTPGFSSCDEKVLMPSISSPDYIPAMLDVCQRYEIRGLLSFFDPDVHRLSAHYDEFLSIGVRPILPKAHAARIAFDKLETFMFLSERSIPVPATTDSITTALMWLETGRFTFPLVVKPRCGFGSANTFVARSKLQLEAFYGYADEMIIQQFIQGDALNVDGLGDLDSKTISVVPWRKFLSRQGETERAMTIEHPELLALGARLIEMVGIIGPFDGDFIQDADGRLWTLELNTRFGGGYPVSHLAGAEFPKLILQMLNEERPACRLGQYQRGVTMMKKLQVIPGPPAEAAEQV